VFIPHNQQIVFGEGDDIPNETGMDLNFCFNFGTMTEEELGVCIIGQGYVGLTLSAAMARSGYDILGIERDEEKLKNLQDGVPHFTETGLEETIQAHQSLGTLQFKKSIESADTVDRSVYIVAVGSPLVDDGVDMTSITSAIDSVADVVEPDDTVIIRSTVIVGTAREMYDRLVDQSSLDGDDEIYYLHAPERTVQGDALAEIENLPQIVGGIDERSTKRGTEIFSRTADVIIDVDSLEASEMIKLFDNTYRDINIAIGNAFGEIARQHGLDGQRLIKLANAGYVRNNIKQPGAGVGGGCLPKDPYLLLKSISDMDDKTLTGSVSELVTTSRDINESMPELTVSQARDALERTGRQDGLSILVLGVAFKGKPSTNDTRNTPAEPIIKQLREHGKIDAYDPDVEPWKIESCGATPVAPESDLSSLFEGKVYDLLIISNNNPVFETLNLYKVRQHMADSPIIVDGWDVLPAETVIELGFHYEVVGGITHSPDEKED
jgi:UDP-N-acetyl-D-mannosaminuronic acid dehydrogenase